MALRSLLEALLSSNKRRFQMLTRVYFILKTTYASCDVVSSEMVQVLPHPVKCVVNSELRPLSARLFGRICDSMTVSCPSIIKSGDQDRTSRCRSCEKVSWENRWRTRPSAMAGPGTASGRPRNGTRSARHGTQLLRTVAQKSTFTEISPLRKRSIGSWSLRGFECATASPRTPTRAREAA